MILEDWPPAERCGCVGGTAAGDTAQLYEPPPPLKRVIVVGKSFPSTGRWWKGTGRNGSIVGNFLITTNRVTDPPTTTSRPQCGNFSSVFGDFFFVGELEELAWIFFLFRC